MILPSVVRYLDAQRRQIGFDALAQQSNDPGNTIASMLANQFGEADGSQVSSLMYAAFVLMLLTLVVNVLAQWVVRRLSLRYT